METEPRGACLKGLWDPAAAGMGSETAGPFRTAAPSPGTAGADQWRAFCVITAVSLLTPQSAWQIFPAPE